MTVIQKGVEGGGTPKESFSDRYSWIGEPNVFLTWTCKGTSTDIIFVMFPPEAFVHM